MCDAHQNRPRRCRRRQRDDRYGFASKTDAVNVALRHVLEVTAGRLAVAVRLEIPVLHGDRDVDAIASVSSLVALCE